MTNVIETYRQKKKLSFADIGRTSGLTHSAVLRHCKGERNIGAEAVLRYHVKLGIPLQVLRPDLFQSE